MTSAPLVRGLWKPPLYADEGPSCGIAEEVDGLRQVAARQARTGVSGIRPAVARRHPWRSRRLSRSLRLMIRSPLPRPPFPSAPLVRPSLHQAARATDATKATPPRRNPAPRSACSLQPAVFRVRTAPTFGRRRTVASGRARPGLGIPGPCGRVRVVEADVCGERA